MCAQLFWLWPTVFIGFLFTVIVARPHNRQKNLYQKAAQRYIRYFGCSFDNKYLSFAEVNTDGTLINTNIKTISIQKAKENPSESIVSNISAPNNSLLINMNYQGFEIMKRENGLYWIIGLGYVFASATNVESAKEYIDELINE